MNNRYNVVYRKFVRQFYTIDYIIKKNPKADKFRWRSKYSFIIILSIILVMYEVLGFIIRSGETVFFF